MSVTTLPRRALAALTTAAVICVGLVGPAFAGSPGSEPVDGPVLADAPAIESGDDAAAESLVEGGEALVATTTEVAAQVETDGEIFVSELHYDNVGTDVGEAVEVEAPVGTDLTGWSIVFYNGSNGAPYGTGELSGVVDDSGVSVLEYPGIQNGSPDGLALVDPGGGVVEFLSYEGDMTGVGGPADGLASTDIGVEQAGNTPIGLSLQRIDGVWTGPLTSTFGARNTAPEPPEEPEPGEVIPIAEIQGSGAATPLDGQTVTTRGVVTAAYPTGGFDGYYIQTAGSGGDSPFLGRTASDALFVYSPSTVDDVQIGDHVEVTGSAGEYFDLTQISVQAGGLTVLDEPAEAVKPIESFTLTGDDGAREPYEGMLVLPASDYVVSDTYALGGWGTNAFGSIGLGLNGALIQETEVALPGTAEFDALVQAQAERAVTLDDGQSSRTASSAEVPYLTGTPELRTGVGVTFAAPVIVDYRFQWNFQPTSPVSGEADDVVTFGGGNTREANETPEDVGGDVTIAAFNVLNYFTDLGEDIPGCLAYTDRAGNPLTVSGGCDARGAWDAENLERQQGKIVAAINTLDADVVGLQEIENAEPFGNDRDASVAALVEALNAAGGNWDFVPSPAEVPADEDVIRTAFIYDPEAVSPEGESQILMDSEAFYNAREPLAQTFTSVMNPDYAFTAVNNHFKSKGGDCGDLPEGCFDGDRTLQAQALTAFADEVSAAAGAEDVFLLGDFNSYSAENPIVALEDAGYTNLNGGLSVDATGAPTGDAEPTYIFDGKIGSLDHVLGNATATERVSGVDVWRINADESVLSEYSRYNYFASEHVEPGTPFRASDHNPVLVGIDVPDATEPTTTTIDVLSINDFHGRIVANGDVAGAAVLACAVDSYREANPNTLFVSAGDNIGASTFVSAVAQDQPTLDVLNAMELDVSAFGNHEFDQGQSDVDDRVIPASDFPYVAANIYGADGERVYDPYALVETGGITVGFVGAITENMPNLVSPSGIEGLEWRDMSTEVNAVAADLTDGDAANGEADVLVVLVHEGSPGSEVVVDGTDFGQLVGEIHPSVTAIISAHSHQTYVQDIDGVWVTQAAQYGELLGSLQLEVDNATGEVIASTAQNIDLVTQDAEGNDIPICEGDPAIQAIVDDAVEAASELGSVAIGEISEDFMRGGNADGSENRSTESSLGNIVADAQLWAAQDVGAEIAMTNAGGLRTDLLYAGSDGGEGDGVVTYEEAANVQPFANTLVVVELTGAQIEQVLEEQWQPLGGAEDLSKLSVSAGFGYVYDPTAPLGERVLEVTLDGEPLAADETYSVVVNSFMASGGDNYATFTEGEQSDTGRIDLTAMVDYFEAQTEPFSVDPVQRSVGVTWVSSPDAEYAPGDEVALDLSSLAYTRDEAKPTEVSVAIDGAEVGSFEVDDTIVSGSDETGQAKVRVTVPDGVSGDAVLEVSDDLSGVIWSTTLTVAEDVADTTKPVATLVSPTTAGPFQELALQVDATDDVGLNRIVANIYSGSTLVRSTQTAMDGATSGTHTATVTLPDGTYTIRYNASDLAGNIAQTGTFTVRIDTTGPSVTIKTGAGFTVGGPDAYESISFKLYDAGMIDRFTLNGVERDLSNNAWSDINYVGPGRFGAVAGENTLVVSDVAGNTTTVSFTLTNPDAPRVTVKTGAGFTVGGPDVYELISFKLYDAQQIDRYVLNGVERDLSNNTWSDINHLRVGYAGAVAGENTLLVYDAAGNVSRVQFDLVG